MAEGTGLASVIPQVSATGILSTVFYILIVILILGIIGVFVWNILKNKKYGEYKVEIFSEDSTHNVYKTYDRAGVFLDKRTGNKLLWLQKSKVGLDPNNPPYVSHLDKKGRVTKTIYLRKIGVNNYVFIDVKLGATVSMTVGEEDLNNANQEMQKIRRSFNKESWLQKYAPYIAFIVTIMIVMIILISLFNKFEVLKDVSSNLITVAEKQLEIAQLMKNSTYIQQNAPMIIGAVK